MMMATSESMTPAQIRALYVSVIGEAAVVKLEAVGLLPIALEEQSPQTSDTGWINGVRTAQWTEQARYTTGWVDRS